MERNGRFWAFYWRSGFGFGLLLGGTAVFLAPSLSVANKLIGIGAAALLTMGAAAYQYVRLSRKRRDRDPDR